MPFDVAAMLPDIWVTNLPAIIVVMPLIIAPVIAALPNWRVSWTLSLITLVISFISALALLNEVETFGRISYALGGFAPPLGIEFVVDGLNAPILLLVTVMSILALVFALPTIVKDIREEKRSLFFTAYLMCVAGLLGVAITGDAFNLFVFLEISSLSTYVLVALGATKDRRALPAAFNYLVMGTIGATFYVIGVGFLFAATGTLNMADMATRIPELSDTRTVQAGFAFIVVGLGLKAAIYPLHQWLPPAYAYAPSFVTVFLSATATKVAFYALARVLFSVFNPELDFQQVLFTWVLAPLAGIAAIVCSFQAVFQTDLRRMLAYSSVAQVGYMLLGLSIGTAAGLSAGMFHLVNHALLKGALFMAVAGVALSIGTTQLSAFAGVARRAPWTMTAMAIAALSLVGIPLTAGFLSKFALLEASLERDWWWAAAVLAISSALAVLYVGRILETAFFKAPGPAQAQVREAPLTLLVPLWILALANIYFGLDASFITGLTDNAAGVAFPGAQP